MDLFKASDFLNSCITRRSLISDRKVQNPVSMMQFPLPKLPDNWCWSSLSELCERVSVGHVGPTSKFFCDSSNGVPFIRSKDVRPGKLNLTQVAYVKRSFHERLRKSQLLPGDILIVRVGANRGDCCVVPDGVGTINCANIVFARPLFRNRFLGFYFNSTIGRSLLDSLTTGSAQGVLNTQSIAAIPVPVPPLPTQRKIASILSAYDDLIENNLRRIKILEEMAQNLYREWFVKFRFPGHEDVRFVDPSLGKIPEGWEVKILRELVKIDKGISYKGKYLTDDGIPMVNLKCILPRGGFNREGTKLYSGEYKSRHKVNPGDLVFSNTDLTQAGNIIGCPAIVPRRGFHQQGIASHHICIIRLYNNCSISKISLFHLFQSGGFREYAKGCASGTTVLGFRSDDALDFKFVMPPKQLVKQFDNIVNDSYELGETLKDRNTNLRQTRDLLLPKLISGEVDVSELDIRIPEEELL